MTVQELSEKFGGTIVVLCKDPDEKSRNTHLVTIINHDIYDSWDSSDWIVKSYWFISNNSDVFSSIDFNEYESKIHDAIDRYSVKYSKFYKVYDKIRNIKVSVEMISNYDIKATLAYRMQYGGEFYDTSKVFTCDIPYKFSPRGTNNDQIIEKVSANHVKQFIKNTSQEISDYEDNAEMLSKYDDKFRGSSTFKQNLRNKLPYWCRKLVIDIHDYGPGRISDWSRYEMDMQPLIGDPRNEEVHFYADNWNELLQQIKYYKDDYSRYGLDY